MNCDVSHSFAASAIFFAAAVHPTFFGYLHLEQAAEWSINVAR
jgi:hypothetical protein